MWRDPLSVEHDFQSVRSALPFGGAGGLHVRRVAEFVRSIDASQIRTEPYLIELAPHLGPLIRDMDASGLDPADLRIVFEALTRLGPSAFPPAQRADFDETVERLRRMLILQYAYAGDLRRVVRYLDVPPGSVGSNAAARSDDADPNAVTDPTAGTDPIARLEALAEDLRSIPAVAVDRLEWALAEWRTHRSRSGAVVPVMESCLGGDPAVYRAGLLRFHVSADPAPSAPSELHLEMPCEQALRTDLRSVPVRAVHALQRRQHAMRIARCRARLRWDGEQSVLCGRSALLAIGVLYFCAGLRHGGSRLLCRVRPDAALSAAMNRHGLVLKIDATTLEPKVRAAFFSWINVLGVPAAQAHSAQRMVDRLRRIFPNRHLEIAAVSSLDDVLADPRLVDLRKTSLREYFARTLRPLRER